MVVGVIYRFNIVSEPLDPITVNETVLQSINCFGDNTGIARIIANGGVPIPLLQADHIYIPGKMTLFGITYN